ncbi:MAG TPA: endonuclease/exonuclease/phosphatase family protein [Ilumatobacteraceae bacterium]|nr:endonuclease/exonuclease/phosphatase family protein [Ilumatobacteraceae bacterium]
MEDEQTASWCIMTWNVHGSQRPDIGAVAAAIRAEAPDIVVIQEIRKGQAESLGEALSMRYSWALKHSPYTTAMRWRSEGMAILTPHLLDAAGHTEISDQQPMRSWRRRIAQWALIGRPDRSMVMIYNLHLSPHEDADSRRLEAARVSEIVAAIGDDPPAIVAGDFNDADDPSIVDALPGIEHVMPSNTNPSQQPTQVLDHVLLPAHATDVSVDLPAGGPDWAAISDHLPVTVRFSLPNVTRGV